MKESCTYVCMYSWVESTLRRRRRRVGVVCLLSIQIAGWLADQEGTSRVCWVGRT